MPVLARTEQNDVEPGAQLRQCPAVFPRRPLRVRGIPWERVGVGRHPALPGQRVHKMLAQQPEVAVGVVEGHQPFVDQKDMDPAPVQPLFAHDLENPRDAPAARHPENRPAPLGEHAAQFAA